MSTWRSPLVALAVDGSYMIGRGMQALCRGVRHTNGITFDRKPLCRPFSCRESRREGIWTSGEGIAARGKSHEREFSIHELFARYRHGEGEEKSDQELVDS